MIRVSFMIGTQHNRGFTLLELLVVIAIIGVLATIVLASLNSVRSKGKDANIAGNMDTIRKQAELYYSNNGRYIQFNRGVPGNPGTTTNVCPATVSSWLSSMFTDPTLFAAFDAARNQTENSDNVRCVASFRNGSQYAIAVELNSVNGAYCIDSRGTGKVFIYGGGQSINSVIENATVDGFTYSIVRCN